MHSFLMITLCAVLFYTNVLEIYSEKISPKVRSKRDDFENTQTSEEIPNDALGFSNESSEISSNNNTSEFRIDELSTSNTLPSKNFRIEESNSTSSSPVPSTKITPNTQSSQLDITLAEIFSNESNSTGSVSQFSHTPYNSTEQTKSTIKSTSLGTSTNEQIIVSSTENEEQEGVIRGKPTSLENITTTTSKTETVYQKALALINDTYILSILIPVAAGIIFASTILVIIATCRCCRRQCRRRRIRKKTLPDSVKHLRPSDRARLLAESSEEEF